MSVFSKEIAYYRINDYSNLLLRTAVVKLHNFPQLLPPAAMPPRPQLLPHFPVLIYSGGPELHGIVAHRKIDIVDRMHQEPVLVLSRRHEKIALYGVVRYQSAKHDPGFFIGFAILIEMVHESDRLLDELVSKRGRVGQDGIAADGRAMPEMSGSRLFFRHDEDADHPGCALLAA
jgi:hypothetical protein